MTVETYEFAFDKPTGGLYLLDITNEVRNAVLKSGIEDGVANISIGSTTTSVRIMVCNNVTKAKLARALEIVAPSDARYMHNRLTGDIYGVGADSNGTSHVRSGLLGPSSTVPIINGKIPLGKNSIVAADFDVIKRRRRVMVQVIGR